MTAHVNAPVIIKRKKVIAGGHHGGAWKVAYADFVTAMMAFFLLMWLLGSTTENQRKGLADYFNTAIPVNRVSGGGSGSFNGDNVFSDENLAQSGSGAAQSYHSDNTKSRGDTGVESTTQGQSTGDADLQEFSDLENLLTGKSGESMVSEKLARHIITRVTDEGLIVELFDLPDATLFDGDSAMPTPLLRDLVQVVSEVFALASNNLAIGGHVQAQPVVRRDTAVWDRSSARAQEVRRLVQMSEFNSDRIQRVTGFADRSLVVSNPMSIRNNRIEMTLLR
ncbi:MAG: chemotaxis protein MotB [Rhodobacterales bacterium]|nr:chemotaxis protein MotB [Rhodobacterales bacterium]